MDVVKNEASFETIKQAEELEWTRNKIRDSGTLVTHLESVKERFKKLCQSKNGHSQTRCHFENGRYFLSGPFEMRFLNVMGKFSKTI